jgi:hypothetical protein
VRVDGQQVAEPEWPTAGLFVRKSSRGHGDEEFVVAELQLPVAVWHCLILWPTVRHEISKGGRHARGVVLPGSEMSRQLRCGHSLCAR